MIPDYTPLMPPGPSSMLAKPSILSFKEPLGGGIHLTWMFAFYNVPYAEGDDSVPSSWSAFIDEIIGVSGGKYAIMGKAPYNLIFYAVREGWVIVMDSIDDMFMEWNG
ncbi:hypothetical protein KY285_005193 [Solanum tuberosum]|nr:hypothetical protein KY284_005420 [Solanum tuberosum]KAH0752045.1 hypothetical protein KY285_005193 [Solanum tuberosum]